MHRPAILRLLPLALFACANEPAADTDAPAGSTGDAPKSGPVWYPEVQTLVVQNCGRCHSDDGDAPFSLDDYTSAKAMAAALLASVEAGTMPPWHADPACQRFEGERILADDQKALLRAWVDAGAPEGDPADAATIEPPSRVTFTPTFTGVVSGYEPPKTYLDDWRCFLFPEIAFTEETWLVGAEVVPGSPAVHHVLVYAIEPDQVPLALEADAAEAGLGYTCFGGPLPSSGSGMGMGMGGFAGGFPNQLGAWVPGIEPELLTDGTARRVNAGSMVVAQVHYNMLYVEPTQDLTEVRLLRGETPPQRLRITSALNYRELDIPAGESDVSFTSRVPYYADDPLELLGFTGHMHMLGSSIRARATAPDQSETCLVDIPKWDFHWQQHYTKPVAEALRIAPGSALELTCTYDNSVENQPLVDGVQQAPKDVGWGESSLDEMCLLYIERIEDYRPQPAADAPKCGASAACLAACGDSPTRCLLECDDTDFGCFSCTLSAAGSCAQTCIAPLLSGARECFMGCAMGSMMLGGNVGECLASECADSYATFADCMDGALAGACAEPLAACGVTP